MAKSMVVRAEGGGAEVEPDCDRSDGLRHQGWGLDVKLTPPFREAA